MVLDLLVCLLCVAYVLRDDVGLDWCALGTLTQEPEVELWGAAEGIAAKLLTCSRCLWLRDVAVYTKTTLVLRA